MDIPVPKKRGENALPIAHKRPDAEDVQDAKTSAILKSYNGDANATAEACRVSPEFVMQVISKPENFAQIKERWNKGLDGLVATKVERQIILTGFLRDTNASKKDRMDALKMLGQMDGDFVERKEITDNRTVNVQFDNAAAQRLEMLLGSIEVKRVGDTKFIDAEVQE